MAPRTDEQPEIPADEPTDEIVAEEAPVEISVNAARTVARLSVPASFNPSDLTAELVLGLASERALSQDDGLRHRVEQLVEDFRARPRAIDEVIAAAVEPVHGENGGFDWTEAFDPAQLQDAGSRGDDGKVDFYNVVRYIAVQPEDHVATLRDPTRGTDGRDVTGATIPARPGRPSDLRFNNSVHVDEHNRVLAAHAGVLHYDARKRELIVIRALEIDENVDFSTGNIDFDGSVMVRQGVRDRFSIRAAEDICVDGLVEGATLIAGRNLILRQGMAARDHGQVLIDGMAEVGYLDGVRGRIRGDLVVRRELMDCDLIVGGALHCSQGAIVGGQVHVTGEAHVGTIGSAAGVPTRLVLGGLPLVAAQLTRLERMTRRLRAERDDLLQERTELTANRVRLDFEEQRRVDALNEQVREFRQRMHACEIKREELVTTIREQRTLDLHVQKMIYGRVFLRIMGQEYMFADDLAGPVHVRWDRRDQVLCCSPGSDEYVPISEVAPSQDLAA